MKINYIARINPFSETATGGGEFVMRELLKFGTGSLGAVEDLSIVTPDKIHEWNPQADLSILADVWNLPNNRGGFDPDWIDDKTRELPYVKFDNAYADVCVHDYFPCRGGSLCNKLVPELYSRASLCYFVSPLHEQEIRLMLGEDVIKKSAVLKPTIDTKMFYNRHYPSRDIDYLYIAPLLPAKGIDNVLFYLEEEDAIMENCLFVGANPRNYNVKGAKYVARLPYEEVPRIMNLTKTFIHLPDWPEPMGRTVIEAALCGCNLIVSDNVGATSFGFKDLTDPDNYKDSIEEFWNTVTSELVHMKEHAHFKNLFESEIE